MIDYEIDLRLGFRIDEVERTLAPLEGVELWQRQGPGVFQTPYAELEQMVRELGPAPGSTVVDLGCAYGRLGIVIARGFPGVKFMGFEICEARVNEARRVHGLLGLDPSQAQVVCVDLASPEFCPPFAEVYFVYDYGTRAAVGKTLEDLKRLRRECGGFQVVGRGRLSRDLIEREHPWLSQVHAPRHLGNFSIYQS